MRKPFHNKRTEKPLINYNIKAREVRIVGEDINDVLPRDEAIRMAQNNGEDLVCINIKADPPICRIMDHGKYLYEKKKKQKIQDKKNRENAVDVKEIQFSPRTDVGDVQVKTKKIQEILDDGDKVKLVMKMRGRENSMKEFCDEQFKNFVSNISSFTYDNPPKRLGNKILAILKKPATIQDNKREKNGK